MKILKYISQIFVLENDKTYWDKKATVLEWQRQTEIKLPENSTKEDIYNTAVKDGYNVSWESISDGFPDYFIELSNLDVSFAISIGVLTAFTAMFVDRIGSEKSEKETGIKSLEKRISEMAEKGYDKNNPFDLRSGLNHRKLGHDIFSFNQKCIPGNYKMRDKAGMVREVADIVGASVKDKFSMSDIIKATYGTKTDKFFGGIWNSIAHTIIHLAKDIVTPNGIPLPFTGLLNKFTADGINVSGYKVTNTILDKVQNEFVTMRASDFTSIGFINLTHSILYQLKESEWKKHSKDTINASKAQLKVLSYSSCIITQMFLYLFQTQDIQNLSSLIHKLKDKESTGTKDRKTNQNDGGTLNWAMLSIIASNVFQVLKYQGETNKQLIKEQQELIDELLKEQE